MKKNGYSKDWEFIAQIAQRIKADFINAQAELLKPIQKDIQIFRDNHAKSYGKLSKDISDIKSQLSNHITDTNKKIGDLSKNTNKRFDDLSKKIDQLIKQ